MQLGLVRGFGKCVNCGQMTSYNLWFTYSKGEYYICKNCIGVLESCIKASKILEDEKKTIHRIGQKIR